MVKLIDNFDAQYDYITNEGVLCFVCRVSLPISSPSLSVERRFSALRLLTPMLSCSLYVRTRRHRVLFQNESEGAPLPRDRH